MRFTEILTIIFVVCKLLGLITWSWWLVLLPEIIAVSIYILVIVGILVTHFIAWRSFNKHF